jgi:hypothetical protein
VVPIDEGFRLCSSVLVSVRFSYRIHWLTSNGEGVIYAYQKLSEASSVAIILVPFGLGVLFRTRRIAPDPQIPTERLGSSTPCPVLYP